MCCASLEKVFDYISVINSWNEFNVVFLFVPVTFCPSILSVFVLELSLFKQNSSNLCLNKQNYKRHSNSPFDHPYFQHCCNIHGLSVEKM